MPPGADLVAGNVSFGKTFTGPLKILELRHRAEAALGPKFNLPAFHDIVLGEGTLPLSLLEANVDRWIAASK